MTSIIFFYQDCLLGKKMCNLFTFCEQMNGTENNLFNKYHFCILILQIQNLKTTDILNLLSPVISISLVTNIHPTKNV